MAEAYLEHVNVTVHDPEATAQMFCDLFDWHIRWQGEAINGGISVHVGGENSYVAVYSAGGKDPSQFDRYRTPGALNHIAVVVDDIQETEARVRKAGFTPDKFADYEPGRRFYFDDMNGIEIEVVSYN